MSRCSAFDTTPYPENRVHANPSVIFTNLFRSYGAALAQPALSGGAVSSGSLDRVRMLSEAETAALFEAVQLRKCWVMTA